MANTHHVLRAISAWAWFLLGIVALGIRFLAIANPQTTEEMYSRTFFPVIRNTIDVTISKLPFPTVYLFIALMLGLFFQTVYKVLQQRGWKERAMHTLRSTFNAAGMLVFFFLIMWGYNYQRIPIFEQLGLEPKPLDAETLTEEMELTRSLLVQERRIIKFDTAAIEDYGAYKDLEELVRKEVADNLYMLGLNYSGRPRTRHFYPAGFMRHMGIYGIYFPFTGESYIDPSLHALEKPFTVAHEMAHSYGVTDEGEANFIAWVICTNSESHLLRYVGHLRLLRYQLNDLYRIDPEEYRVFASSLPAGVRNDLASIRRNVLSITPMFAEVSRRSNDLYLKTQGVKAGVKSYSQLPMLVYAWRRELQGF